VHTVVETPAYLTAAKSLGVGDAMRAEIVAAVSADPRLGALLVGTGGCRKFRWGKDGKGKSGGVRIVSFFGGEEMPVFLLTIFAKNEKASLSKGEANDLGVFTRLLAETYRGKAR
jgi:hypothetical protein